jgi:hypothetical protein
MLLLAGLFSIASISMAAAAEDATECGLDARRVVQVEASVDGPAAAERRGPRKVTRTMRDAANVSVGQRPAVSANARRRNGSLRRVPDAVLIDGRGVL